VNPTLFEGMQASVVGEDDLLPEGRKGGREEHDPRWCEIQSVNCRV
jgi:hypothetical protein